MRVFGFWFFLVSFSTLLSGQADIALERNSKSVQISDSVKWQASFRIYQKLTGAKGDFRISLPSLEISLGNTEPAWLDYQRQTIGIDEKAFDLCLAQGPHFESSLATLLAHELVHFYENHGWRAQFSSRFRDMEIGQQLHHPVDKIVNETQADYLGGFLAVQAGFPLYENLPEFKKLMTDGFDLPHEATSSYPSLHDRMAISRRTVELLRELVDVFDMATYLTAVGHYELSNAFLHRVVKDFQSRELYNNIGINLAMQSLAYFEEEELKYAYPFEMDLRFPSASRGDGVDMRLMKRRQLLTQAIDYFDAAVSYDKAYLPAILNKACAYALLGDTVRAAFFLQEELLSRLDLDSLYSKTLLDGAVLKGILAAERGAKANAEAIFREAATKGSILAGKNLQVLKGELLRDLALTTNQAPQEVIENLRLQVFAQSPEADTDMRIQDEKIKFYTFKPQGKPGLSRIFISSVNDGQSNFFFHYTLPEYGGSTSKGLKVGSTLEDIEAAYGKTDRILETATQTLLVYPKLQAVFFLDAHARLQRWGCYYQEDHF